MRSLFSVSLPGSLTLVLCAAGLAHAQLADPNNDSPDDLGRPGLALPAGALEVMVPFNVNLSASASDTPRWSFLTFSTYSGVWRPPSPSKEPPPPDSNSTTSPEQLVPNIRDALTE